MSASLRSAQPVATPRVTAKPGDRLQLAPGHLWTLNSGEVVVYVHGRPIDVWRAPRPLDVCRILGDRVHTAFIAASDVQVSGIPLDHVSEGELMQAVRSEARALWHRVDTDARRDDDSFLPRGRPAPGPWHFRKVSARMLVVQGSAKRLRIGLPRRVVPLPGAEGRYLLVVARMADAGSLDDRVPSRFIYHEVTPFLPVWSGRRGPAMFVPELYPDAGMATLLGQVIHGFPKRTARVGFYDDGADLIVDRRHAVRLRFSGAMGMAAPEALGQLTETLFRRSVRGPVATLTHALRNHLRLPILLDKYTPDLASAGATGVRQVVRVPFHLDPIRAARALSGLTLDLAGGPGVLHGDVLGGWELETGFRFGSGRVERRGAKR